MIKEGVKRGPVPDLVTLLWGVDDDDAAGGAEEAGEREPERPQAHEEGRLPRERRVQQRHSLDCVRVS